MDEILLILFEQRMEEKAELLSNIKSKANSSMKSGMYVEAIKLYTQGISLQPSNPILYSNRSLAFLKLSQYFFAIKDAETVIRLAPDWPKGYYRKGQAEYGVESYKLAVKTFEKGLANCPGDKVLTQALDDGKKRQKELEIVKMQTYRRYTVFSSVVCSLLVIADMFAHSHAPVVRYTWLRPVLISLAGAFGYFVASVVVAFQQASKASLLDPPLELLHNPQDFNFDPLKTFDHKMKSS